MIDNRELRIGNWVMWDHGIQVLPQRVTADTIEILDRNSACADPIPLTPEILEKAGFEFGVMPFTNECGYSKRGSGYFIGLTENYANGWLFHNPHFDINYKYLHQLQNLYFCLTGEELEINL